MVVIMHHVIIEAWPLLIVFLKITHQLIFLKITQLFEYARLCILSNPYLKSNSACRQIHLGSYLFHQTTRV